MYIHNKMLRSFIAIPIEKQEIIDNVHSIQNKIKKTSASIKYVKQKNFHILLKFLGNISNNTKSKIIPLLSEISNKHSSFNIKIEGVDVFPSLNYIRVIWVGVSKGKRQLEKLSKDIENFLTKINIPKENRKYIPHITLGRMNSGKNKEEVKKIIENNKDSNFGEIEVNEFKLFKSDLTKKGPIYTVLKTYKL